MNYYGDPLNRLIEELGRLPGIGAKSAQRLAFYLINQPEERATSLAAAITDAKKNIRYCGVCCNITDADPCAACSDPKREKTTVMVVEDPRDMAAYERTNEYRGLYHILHGAISPLNGVGPNDLRIKELLSRLQDGSITEIILATNPDVEGEATAMYLNKLIKPLNTGVKVTRIARGVPVGGDIEYVDQVTLSRALSGRQEM
uniref:Recombination protein RecR n=1 Tax=uncultured bacterium contig00081 TaxID=1181557 RepID=A0A806KEV5_9BACT|nr:recombination protein RecR [uncultured bacterium contig00081]